MELKELIDLSNKAFQERNFKKVIDLLKKVIVLQPDRYEIYLRLGLASSSLGNLKEAIDSYLNDGIDNPTLIKDLLTIVGERQLTAQEEYKKMSDLVKNLRK